MKLLHFGKVDELRSNFAQESEQRLHFVVRSDRFAELGGLHFEATSVQSLHFVRDMTQIEVNLSFAQNFCQSLRFANCSFLARNFAWTKGPLRVKIFRFCENRPRLVCGRIGMLREVDLGANFVFTLNKGSLQLPVIRSKISVFR